MALTRFIAAAVLTVVVLVPPAWAQSERARGWLGVGMSPARSGKGVEVQRVVRGSPAAKAGLKAGDRIVRVDGAPVSFAEDVTKVVRAHSAGENARVEVVRGDATLKLLAEVVAAPPPDEVLRMDHLGAPMRAWDRLKPVHGVFPSTADALAGRVVVVEFWATWCGPCRITAPVLDRWQRELGAQGLTVLGISAEEPDVVAAHGVRAGTRYGLASDVDGATSRSYGISSLPTFLVMDRKGIVREVAVGFDPDRFARTEALLRTLLAEPAAPR